MPRKKEYDVGEVLEKAMHVFWENGYKATSIRQLEKAMNINQFSIYASFRDKHNLFIESLRKYGEYVRANVFYNLLKANAGLADIEKFLFDISENVSAGRSGKGCLIVNTAGEIGTKDKLIYDEVQSYFSFIKEMFKSILKRASERGEISADADTDKYANYLLGIMQSMSLGMKVLDQKQLSDFVSMALIPIK